MSWNADLQVCRVASTDAAPCGALWPVKYLGNSEDRDLTDSRFARMIVYESSPTPFCCPSFPWPQSSSHGTEASSFPRPVLPYLPTGGNP